MPPKKPGDAAAKTDPDLQPKKWWQWVLVYPTLVVALAGSMPTALEFYKSYKLKVPFGKSYDAASQNKLWEQNFDCARSVDFRSIKNRYSIEIGSMVCDSGDVLLRSRSAGAQEYRYKWVAWSDIGSSSEKAAAFSIFSKAYAGTIPTQKLTSAQYGPALVCQRWVGNGLLLRRYGTPSGCFDEVVNTFNGWVVQRYASACMPC